MDGARLPLTLPPSAGVNRIRFSGLRLRALSRKRGTPDRIAGECAERTEEGIIGIGEGFVAERRRRPRHRNGRDLVRALPRRQERRRAAIQKPPHILFGKIAGGIIAHPRRL